MNITQDYSANFSTRKKCWNENQTLSYLFFLFLQYFATDRLQASLNLWSNLKFFIEIWKKWITYNLNIHLNDQTEKNNLRLHRIYLFMHF